MNGLKLNKDTVVTSGKKFVVSPEFGYKTGLCRGKIQSVEVKLYDAKDDAKQESFKGLKNIPRLEVVYEQLFEGESGTFKQSFNVIEHKDIVYREDGAYKSIKYKKGDMTWQTKALFTYIKHIIEAVTAKPFTDEFTLNVTIEEMDGQAVVTAFTKFFNDIAEYLNGGKGKNAKPIYTDKVLWMKMLVANNDGNLNKKGNPELPAFVGDGTLEPYVEGKRPYISIKVADGESIIPRVVTSAPKPMTNASPMASTDSKPVWAQD